MSAVSGLAGQSMADHPLCRAFLKWQCRVRQMSVRHNHGRPDEGIAPDVYPGPGGAAAESFGRIITVLNKAPGYSVTAELDFIAAKTHDPAARREQALRFLSATYYQKAGEFSDILTATFPPGSPGAARLRAEGAVTLKFDAFSQRFGLVCKVWKLAAHNPLYRATIAHNRLFNPALPPDVVVLGFEPDWARCSSDPALV